MSHRVTVQALHSLDGAHPEVLLPWTGFLKPMLLSAQGGEGFNPLFATKRWCSGPQGRKNEKASIFT